MRDDIKLGFASPMIPFLVDKPQIFHHTLSSCLYLLLSKSQYGNPDIGGSTDLIDLDQEDVDDGNKSSGEKNAAPHIEHLTPAERRYMEQRQKIDVHKLAKTANKSHRDRISDFNQYLANMSEHYDIPKVGPG